MSKRLFWRIFWPSWDQAVPVKNIQSGFRKTGIFPFDPETVLPTLAIQPHQDLQSSEISQNRSLPKTGVPEVRRIIKQIKNTAIPSQTAITQLIETAEILSFENDLLRHEKSSLQETILLERSKRKRGKKIGLLSPDQPKYGQFFSPEKISRLKLQKQQEEEDQIAQKAAAEEAKLQQQIQRDEKQRKITEQKAENERQRHARRVAVAAEKETKRKAREETKQARLADQKLRRTIQEAQRALQRAKNHPNPVDSGEDLVITENRVIQTSGRSGRTIRPPIRFEVGQNQKSKP